MQVRDARSTLQVRGVCQLQKEPAGEIFPEGCARPATSLPILSPPSKDLAWAGTRVGLNLSERLVIREFRK